VLRLFVGCGTRANLFDGLGWACLFSPAWWRSCQLFFGWSAPFTARLLCLFGGIRPSSLRIPVVLQTSRGPWLAWWFLIYCRRSCAQLRAWRWSWSYFRWFPPFPVAWVAVCTVASADRHLVRLSTRWRSLPILGQQPNTIIARVGCYSRSMLL